MSWCFVHPGPPARAPADPVASWAQGGGDDDAVRRLARYTRTPRSHEAQRPEVDSRFLDEARADAQAGRARGEVRHNPGAAPAGDQAAGDVRQVRAARPVTRSHR